MTQAATVLAIVAIAVGLWLIGDAMHKKILLKQKRKEEFPTRGGNDNIEERLCALECAIVAYGINITKLTKQGVKIMAELQDVKNAVAQVKIDMAAEKAEVAAEIQKLKDQIGQGSPVTAADLDELVVSINEIGSGIKDIVTPT